MLVLKLSSSWSTVISIWDKSQQRSLCVFLFFFYSAEVEIGSLNRHTSWHQAGDSRCCGCICLYRALSQTPLIRFSLKRKGGTEFYCSTLALKNDIVWLHYSTHLLITDWLKWVVHHSADTTCVSVVLFILLAIQLMIRHSSRSGTGAAGLNAKSSQKPTGAMCIVLQPQGA